MRSNLTNTAIVLSSLALLPHIVAAQAPVRTAMVQEEIMQQRHRVTGSLRAVSRGDLAALEAGRVTTLNARAGHRVGKGDVLARVDARRLEAQKGEALAEQRVAEADLKSQIAIVQRAEAEFARVKNLVTQNVITRDEYDERLAEARVARANVEATQRRIERIKKSIELLDVRLSDTVVRAPYDARVVQRHVEPGDWVQPGETLLTLVSTGPIEAWLEVPERYIRSLEAFGDSVVVRSHATGESSSVLSTRRVADVNRRVRTLNFVVTVDNKGELLSPGMSVDGWIAVTGSVSALAVPKDAVIRGHGEPFVYSIEQKAGNAVASKIPIRVLFESRDLVAIDSVAIHKGDQVIVEGNERLLPGQRVAVTATTQSSVSAVASR